MNRTETDFGSPSPSPTTFPPNSTLSSSSSTPLSTDNVTARGRRAKKALRPLPSRPAAVPELINSSHRILSGSATTAARLEREREERKFVNAISDKDETALLSEDVQAEEEEEVVLHRNTEGFETITRRAKSEQARLKKLQKQQQQSNDPSSLPPSSSSSHTTLSSLTAAVRRDSQPMMKEDTESHHELTPRQQAQLQQQREEERMKAEQEYMRRSLEEREKLADQQLLHQRAHPCYWCLPCLSSCSTFFASSTLFHCFASCAQSLTSFITLETTSRLAYHELRQGCILPSAASLLSPTALHGLTTSHILSIFIQGCEMELEADVNLIHPMVRVSIVDMKRGMLFKKSERNRNVVSALEGQRMNPAVLAAGGGGGAGGEPFTSYDTITPIMTAPCSLRNHRNFTPIWNETLIWNEQLPHLIKPETLLFFEILDFGQHVNLNRIESEDGYHKVAFAFLKLLSTTTGRVNMGEMKLQLYRYSYPSSGSSSSSSSSSFPGLSSLSSLFSPSSPPLPPPLLSYHLFAPHIPPVYVHWIWQKHMGRNKYPSVLKVKIAGKEGKKREKVRGKRVKEYNEVEEGRVRFEVMYREEKDQYGNVIISTGDNTSEMDTKQANASSSSSQYLHSLAAARRSASLRRRAITDPCLIPNSPLHSISCGLYGCFILRYSPDGSVLAAACGESQQQFTVKLYDADTAQQLYTFVGHLDLIYDLGWNTEGNEIVSSSSDTSVKIWYVDVSSPGSIANDMSPHPSVTFSHPCFVYCAQFHPRSSSHLLITGAFDGIIRIWSTETKRLLLTLQEHSAMINCISWMPNGSKFFSADAKGVIKIWEDRLMTRGGGSGSGEENNRFICFSTIVNDRVVGSVITCLRYHPRPERLLVYTRDNCLYSLSLLRYDIKRTLTGLPSRSHTLHCSISPDGQYAIAGAEDGNAYVYELSSGKLIKVLEVGFRLGAMSDVVWHPGQHAVAMGSFGADAPIVVWEYVKSRDTGGGAGGGGVGLLQSRFDTNLSTAASELHADQEAEAAQRTPVPLSASSPRYPREPAFAGLGKSVRFDRTTDF